MNTAKICCNAYQQPSNTCWRQSCFACISELHTCSQYSHMWMGVQRSISNIRRQVVVAASKKYPELHWPGSHFPAPLVWHDVHCEPQAGNRQQTITFITAPNCSSLLELSYKYAVDEKPESISFTLMMLITLNMLGKIVVLLVFLYMNKSM